MEDDSTTYRALRAIFQRRGWSVTVATTVAEAMEAIDGRRFDFIILDLMLPDGDGASVLERVRRESLPVRVVVTTGCSDEHRLSLLADVGDHILMRKPVDLAELYRNLEH